MRRALVLIALVAAGLTAASSALAPAAKPTSAAEEVEREVTFYLHTEGFAVIFDTTDNDGRDEAFLEIRRGPLTARYFTSAIVTAHAVKARFGNLGELDYSYAPEGEVETTPNSGERPNARFEGTFTFTGEHGYVHIDADSVRGFLHEERIPGARSSPPRRTRRAVPYRPSYSDEGATLEIIGGSKRSGRFREVSAYDSDDAGHSKVFISGQLWERRPGGLGVGRGAIVRAGAGAFRRDLDAGTASLRPPGPFTGSARFTRRGDGSGIWTGSLRVPILGGQPIELAGPDFRGHLHKGVPVDE